MVKHDNGLEETFKTTEEHPFYIDGQGWRKASILEHGMKMLDKDGNASATIISQEKLEETDTVYNFEVQDFHTYHIGEIGLWVHNAKCCELDSIMVDGKEAKAIGTGGNKVVYEIDDNTVIAKMKTGKKTDDLYKEVEMLQKLDDLGFPVVKARITNHDGQPAMIMDKYSESSKSIIAVDGKKLQEMGNSSVLNSRSIKDLEDIKSKLQNNKIKIHDLQFLFDKNGRVVINDPLKIETVRKVKLHDKNIKMIDLLIKKSKENMQ